MKIKESSISPLSMTDMVFEEIYFKRTAKVSFEASLSVDFSHRSEEISKNDTKITLICHIRHPENHFEARLVQSAIFTIDANNEMRDSLLGANAMAIMFPFMRSQLTLLTAQPNFPTVILPVLNINNIVNDADES